MFDRHFQEILNAILTVSNNARAERINGAIEELKQIVRGFRKINKISELLFYFFTET
ncbi:MAG: hypothetical protein RL308_3490 [Bacteroidota bacterium]|jgi:transposase